MGCGASVPDGTQEDVLEDNPTSPVSPVLVQHNILQRISDVFTLTAEPKEYPWLDGVTDLQKATCRKTGKIWAARLSDKKRRSSEAVHLEYEILKCADHPNIVRIRETFEDARFFYAVVDFCTGGPLIDALAGEEQQPRETEMGRMLQQMFGALAHLHERQICHRDFRPEKLMLGRHGLTDPSVYICSLDLACWFKPGVRMTERVGGVACSSPEMLAGDYTEACDVWSAGVVVFTLLAGHLPFEGRTDEEVEANVKMGTAVVKYPLSERWCNSIDAEPRLFVEGLLHVDEKHRPSAAEARDGIWLSKLRLKRAESVAKTKSRRGSPDQALNTRTIENMKHFSKKNKVQRAALNVIARDCTEEEIGHLRQAFEAIDINGDGVISQAELKIAVGKTADRAGRDGGWRAEKISSINIEELLCSLDENQDFYLSYSEFIAATLSQKQYQEEAACWAAFRAFDVDGSGAIDKKELSNVLALTCENGVLDQKTIDSAFKGIDGNGDGQLDFEEFMGMIRSWRS